MSACFVIRGSAFYLYHQTGEFDDVCATFRADDGDDVRTEYRHGIISYIKVERVWLTPPDIPSGELTLAGAVSKGVSLTNIAGNRELDFRFLSCWKKLSTGIFRLRRKPFPLSAGKRRIMSLIISPEVCQSKFLVWERPVSGCKVTAL